MWVTSWLALFSTFVGVVTGADAGFDRVTKHTAVFGEPPKHVPTQGMPDGPLLGNGDLGVALAGPPEAQRFYVGKNDFWRRNPSDASIMPVGSLCVYIPELRGASYRQELDLARAEVRGAFANEARTVRTRSWVEANENLFVTSLRYEGNAPLELSVRQTPGAQTATPTPIANQDQRSDKLAPAPETLSKDSGVGEGSQVEEGLGTLWFTRKADALPGRSREVAMVTRILGAIARPDGRGGLIVTLRPGESIAVVSVVLSDLDTPEFLTKAKQRVAALPPKDLATTSAAHQQWWAGFWGRSFVEIPDQEIEKRWYAALCIMGSCSRAGKVAPGLWGNWVTTDRPNWHGDFHLNYNFQAPYYMVYSANHAELSLPFYQAIWESVPNGRAMAQRHGWKGVHFPVCIGPWGLSPENPDGDWGQRSDAAFAALNFIWQYQYTQDRDFLRTNAYPYLREVADFWEDYLKLENDRYVIYNDSIHEGSGADMNPVLSLGLVRTLFRNLIPMSETLGVDAERRAKWRDICARISAFPVQERGGKTVFRYSEKGTAWVGGNTLGIPIFSPPAPSASTATRKCWKSATKPSPP